MERRTRRRKKPKSLQRRRSRRSSHRLFLQNAHIALSSCVERSSGCPWICFQHSRLVQRTAYKALTSDELFLNSSAPLLRRLAGSALNTSPADTPCRVHSTSVRVVCNLCYASHSRPLGLQRWYREPSNPRCLEPHERVATRPRRPQPWVDVRVAVVVDNPRAGSSAQSARCAWSLPFDPSSSVRRSALSRHLER
jgi:hypothetical protein